MAGTVRQAPPHLGKEMPTLCDMRQHNYDQKPDTKYDQPTGHLCDFLPLLVTATFFGLLRHDRIRHE
jgi:hypothetical protein